MSSETLQLALIQIIQIIFIIHYSILQSQFRFTLIYQRRVHTATCLLQLDYRGFLASANINVCRCCSETSLSQANHLLDVPDSLFAGAHSTCIQGSVLGSVFTCFEHTGGGRNNVQNCMMKENKYKLTHCSGGNTGQCYRCLTDSSIQCVDSLSNMKRSCSDILNTHVKRYFLNTLWLWHQVTHFRPFYTCIVHPQLWCII